MKRELLVLLIALLVAGSLGAGYLTGVDNRQTTTSTYVTTSTETSTCDSTYSPSLVEGTMSNSSSLLFVTNSTAWVCIDIYNNNNNTVSSNPVVPPGVAIAKQGTWAFGSTGLKVTSDPDSFSLPPNSVNWYLFEITPVNATQAVYAVAMPNPCWGYFFVAVGYSVTQLQHTRLDLASITSSCPVAVGRAQVEGFINMVAVYSE
jgi:hypothetical protein